MKRVRWLRGEPVIDGIEGLIETQFLDLILGGEAELDIERTGPPMNLVERIANGVSKPSVFGPRIETPNLVKTVDASLFKHGVRQHHFNGNPISWFRSGKEILQAMKDQACRGGGFAPRVFDQLDRLHHHVLRTKGRQQSRFGRLSAEEMAAECLIPGRVVNVLDTSKTYLQLPDVWFDFHSRYKSLTATLKSTFEQALSEGRVICAQSDRSGDRFLSAPEAAKLKIHKREPDLHFCFSADLPNSLFDDGSTRSRRKKDAGKWMAKAYRLFEAQGRRVKVSDLKCEARRRFNLSENAVKEAWEQREDKFKVATGPPGKVRTVKRFEINALE